MSDQEDGVEVQDTFNSDLIDPNNYEQVELEDANKPMDQATGKKILDMLLESKEENRRLLNSIEKLQEDRRKEFLPERPDHLPSRDDVQWKNVGCQEQFGIWDDQWNKVASADIKLDYVAMMLQQPNPDVNKIKDFLAEATTDLKDGKEKGEQRMHDLLLVNDHGWDFLRQYKKPKIAINDEMAKDIKSTLKIMKERKNYV